MSASLATLAADCPTLVSNGSWNAQQIGRLLGESIACQRLATALLEAAAGSPAAPHLAAAANQTQPTAAVSTAARRPPPLAAAFLAPSAAFSTSLNLSTLEAATADAAWTIAAPAMNATAAVEAFDDDEFWPLHVRVLMTVIFSKSATFCL